MYRIPAPCKRFFWDISRTSTRNDLQQQAQNLLQMFLNEERWKQMQDIKISRTERRTQKSKAPGAEALLMELLCLEGQLEQENVEAMEVRKRLQSMVSKSTASLGEEESGKARALEREIAGMETEEGEILTLEQVMDTQAKINSLRHMLLERLRSPPDDETAMTHCHCW